MDPNDPMRNVNWANATVAFSSPPVGCPTGDVAFRPTEFEGNWGSGPGATWPKASFLTDGVAIGDLTGDGRAEAALTISCMIDPGSDELISQVLVVGRRDDGSLHTLGWTGRESSSFYSSWIADGLLFVDARPQESSQTWEYRLGQVHGYRWTGNAFEAVNTVDRYPPIGGAVDLSAMAAKLRCHGLPPREKLMANFDTSLKAADGDRQWSLAPRAVSYANVWVKQGSAATADLLLEIGCRPSGSNAEYATTIVIITRSQGMWAATGAGITSTSPTGSVRITSVHGSKVSVSDTAAGPDSPPVDYTWTGREFVR
ncbi:MAG TPA: hypothetical protein DGT23_24280 [Micromonosporaceae bacterium]|nr:hypothetical protein [Micromonosporaceae bacterium]